VPHHTTHDREAISVPIVKLSDLTVAKLKSSDKHTDYFDQTLATFGVRVSPKGTKTFILKLRSGRQALGRYPILSLSEARTEAKRLLAERTLGRIRPRSITYQQAIKLFIEDKRRSRRANTADQYEWFLNRLDFGQLADIHHDDVERQIAKIRSRSTYDHVLVAARIFFNWCIKRRYIENNPTAGLSPHGTPQRSRVLTDEELGRIWRACEQRGESGGAMLIQDLRVHATESGNHAINNTATPSLPANFARIVQLLILTGLRRGEAAAIQKSWIRSNGSLQHTEHSAKAASQSVKLSSQHGITTSDLWQLTIPSTHTKNGREHTIPLGALSATLLTKAMNSPSSANGYIFSARTGSSNACFSGWSKASAALWKITGIEGATLHDLRRSYATNMARLGVPLHIIEKLLNHVSGSFGGIVGVYQRHEFKEEMAEAVQKYENFIQEIVR
jgi:integrase